MTHKKMNEFILIITSIATALIAGLFYAYTCSVNIGLGRLPDKEYIAAMQSINSAIQNPLFFASFMGALVLLPLSAWINYGQQPSVRFMFLIAAAIVYLVGVFGVTVGGNVPLNNTLAGINLSSATLNEIAHYRSAFEKPWLMFHQIRTIASVICLILVVLSCIYQHKNDVKLG